MRQRFTLPRVNLGFETRIAGGIKYHAARLYTVILEPDAARLILVWQTALFCHHTLYSLSSTRIYEKRTWPARRWSER